MRKRARKAVSPPSVLVLMAALNEEEGIGHTISELKSYLDNSEFLVVDGNSDDQTARTARRLGAKVIFQEGKGKGDAIAHALARIDGDYDYVLLTDAD